MSSRSVRRGGC